MPPLRANKRLDLAIASDRSRGNSTDRSSGSSAGADSYRTARSISSEGLAEQLANPLQQPRRAISPARAVAAVRGLAGRVSPARRRSSRERAISADSPSSARRHTPPLFRVTEGGMPRVRSDSARARRPRDGPRLSRPACRVSAPVQP